MLPAVLQIICACLLIICVALPLLYLAVLCLLDLHVQASEWRYWHHERRRNKQANARDSLIELELQLQLAMLLFPTLWCAGSTVAATLGTAGLLTLQRILDSGRPA